LLEILGKYTRHHPTARGEKLKAGHPKFLKKSLERFESTVKRFHEKLGKLVGKDAGNGNFHQFSGSGNSVMILRTFDYLLLIQRTPPDAPHVTIFCCWQPVVGFSSQQTTIKRQSEPNTHLVHMVSVM